MILFIVSLAGSFFLGKWSQPSENLNYEAVTKHLRKVHEKYQISPKFQVCFSHNITTQQLESWVDIGGFVMQPVAKYLKNTHDISFLTIGASRVSAEDMRYIASLRSSLVFLRFDSCEIEEESIPLLCGLKLRSLELCDHPPSAHWVKVIASMQSLEELHLWRISDFRSYAQMLPNLPKLKVLTLHDVKVTPEDIAAFQKMKSLERMFVDDEYKNHPEIQKLVTSQMNPVKIYGNSESGGRPYILFEHTGSL